MITESRIVEKIQEILDEQRLETDDLFAIGQQVRKFRQQKRMLPHSLHLTVFDQHDEPFHLRVLVWASEEWRQTRLDCIAHHRKLYASTQRTERAFRVPRMIKSGNTPLIWDLTEYVDARNLPWHYPGTRRLHEHIRRVDAFFRVSDDLARVRLRSVAEREWPDFVSDLRRWARWANHTGILSNSAATDIENVTREFEIALPKLKSVLTHGDFNASNMMFPTRGKPWLIDFDHLRRSVPAENIARLLTVSWLEAGWRERVFKKADSRFDGPDRIGFAATAAWHTMNTWRHELVIWPVRQIRSLDQLTRQDPKLKFRINQQRNLLERIIDEFAS